MVDHVSTPATANAGTGRPPVAGAGAVRPAPQTASAGRQQPAHPPVQGRPPEPHDLAARLPPQSAGDIRARGRGVWWPSRFAGVASSPAARFLTIFSVGVASTLAWQSYSDAGREAAARWCQSIAPPAAPALVMDSAPPAPEPRKVAAAPAHEAAVPAPSGASAAEDHGSDPKSDVLKSTSQALAGVRESMDRLAAELAKLPTADHGAADRAASAAAMAAGQPPASKPPSRPGR